jgi:hypothetical protein
VSAIDPGQERAMGPRISVARLLALVATSGLALASLRAAGPLWASILLTAVVLALTLGGVAAVCRLGRGRAFWVGFSIAGLIHVSFCFGLGLEPNLLTTALIDLSYQYVAPPPADENDLTELDLERVRTLAARFGLSGPVGIQEESTRRRWYKDHGLDFDYFGWGDGPRLHSTETYREIGHSWMTLVVAVAVGKIAVRLHDSRKVGA